MEPRRSKLRKEKIYGPKGLSKSEKKKIYFIRGEMNNEPQGSGKYCAVQWKEGSGVQASESKRYRWGPP